MQKKILLFIPVYNCEKQISRVLEKIDLETQSYFAEIIIIDNRSTDDTLDAAKTAAKKIKSPLKIMRNNENYNLGGSIKRAFLYAIENNFDYIVSLHGDDQANIRDVLPYLVSGEYEQYDLLIGARFHKDSVLKGYSLTRKIGNKVLNLVCSLLNNRKIDDLIAGLNAFKVNFLRENFFLRFPDNLTFDAHLLLYALNKKAHIKFIPITWREEDQISNAKVVRQAIIILQLFARYMIFKEKVFLQSKTTKSENFSLQLELVWNNIKV